MKKHFDFFIGSIARGDMSFTSTEPVLHVASVDEPVLHVPRAGSEINVAGPSVGSETNVAGLTLDREACEVQSPPSGTSVHGSGKKRKKSQVASVLDDYLEHKKNQTDKTVEAFLEKKTRGEESMDRCIHIFEAMEDLTDEEKAIAAEVFENELYREMFLKLTIHNVRLIWLRRKIRYVYIYALPSSLKTIVNSKETCVFTSFLISVGLHLPDRWRRCDGWLLQYGLCNVFSNKISSVIF